MHLQFTNYALGEFFFVQLLCSKPLVLMSFVQLRLRRRDPYILRKYHGDLEQNRTARLRPDLT